MSIKENKALVRRWHESFHQWNVDLADEIVAPDLVYHGTEIRGIDGYKEWITWASTILPDMQATIEHLIAEGDKVVFRHSATATHKGEWLGIPATGKQVEFTQTGIVRIADGKIAELWDDWDAFGVFQQLGGIPEP